MVPTPFTEDREKIRHDKLERNLTALKESGVKQYIPCGGTGEIANLTQAERLAVAETTVNAVGDQGTIFAGVEGNVKDARRLIERYEEIGVDGVMIRRGDHPACGPHQRSLLEYYRTLARVTDLGVMIYKDSPTVTDSMIEELVTLENVVAVKYKDDVASFSRTRNLLPEDTFEEVAWINGRAENAAIPFAVEGVPAFTTSLGNFLPEACLDLFDALVEGEWERARRVRDALHPYLEIAYREHGPDNTIPGAYRVPAVKYGQDLAGFYGGLSRPPVLEELPESAKERARTAYEHVRRTVDEAARSK